jgi:glycosyltransferase involved in cell wall biosynthesis
LPERTQSLEALPGRLSAWVLRRGAIIGAPAIALVGLTALALLERIGTLFRRVRRRQPRLLWGPTAILNIKYDSAAMRARGYQSETYVSAPSVITGRGDFDHHRDDFNLPKRLEAVRDYYILAWAMRRADVFLYAFDLGILRQRPLQWLEYPLLRLAGKKLIVTPYGGDAAVEGHLGRFEDALFADYPELPGLADLFTRRIHHTLRWANVSVRTHGIAYQPDYDVLWVSRLSIDADAWSNGGASDHDGRNGPVMVVHAPNHRHIKGTEYLERAVAELRDEGLDVRLEVLEGRPNEEVRRALSDCDIVADQFLLGYGFFAVEGMAAGKPVLSNMDAIFEAVRSTEQIRTCPIVDTGPESLRDDLRRLVLDPALRASLGREGREFVRRYHSYEAIGERWEAIVQFAWSGKPLPRELAPRSQSDE